MKFSYLTFALVGVLALSSCTEDASHSQNATPPEAIVDEEREEASLDSGVASSGPENVEDGRASEVLPFPGLVLEYPYEIQSDTVFYQERAGQYRRGIVVAFQGDSIETVFASTSDSLKRLGFYTKGDASFSDGVIGQSFYGRGGMYVEAHSGAPKRRKNPDSTGVVVLSWPVKSQENPEPLFVKG